MKKKIRTMPIMALQEGNMRKFFGLFTIFIIIFALMSCMQPIGGSDLSPAPADTVSVVSVSLNKTTLTLVVGGQDMIIATTLPDDATVKTVTWLSSDESVATVKDGIVTAIKVGTATIIATTTDGSKIAKCELTVTATTVVLADTKVISETGYMIDFAGNATGSLVENLTFSDKTAYKRFWLVKDGKHYIVDATGVLVENSTKVMTGMWLTESGKDVGWCVFVENTSSTSNDGWYITRW